MLIFMGQEKALQNTVKNHFRLIFGEQNIDEAEEEASEPLTQALLRSFIRELVSIMISSVCQKGLALQDPS